MAILENNASTSALAQSFVWQSNDNNSSNGSMLSKEKFNFFGVYLQPTTNYHVLEAAYRM